MSKLIEGQTKAAIEHIRTSPYPYDAIHPLVEARKVLTNILQVGLHGR